MNRKPLELEACSFQMSLWSMLRRNWRWLTTGLAILLAYGALKEAPWAEVWTLMSGLGAQAIVVLLLLNLLMLPLMSARWWFILRLLGQPISLFGASLYRCSSNSVSYLTPGPHFGGEPLLVWYLSRYHAVPISSGTTSVLVDRLLELLASVLAFALCLIYVLANNIVVLGDWYSLAGVIALLVGFLGLLVTLFSGKSPFSNTLRLFLHIPGFSLIVTPGKWHAF